MLVPHHLIRGTRFRREVDVGVLLLPDEPELVEHGIALLVGDELAHRLLAL